MTTTEHTKYVVDGINMTSTNLQTIGSSLDAEIRLEQIGKLVCPGLYDQYEKLQGDYKIALERNNALQNALVNSDKQHQNNIKEIEEKHKKELNRYKRMVDKKPDILKEYGLDRKLFPPEADIYTIRLCMKSLSKLISYRTDRNTYLINTKMDIGIVYIIFTNDPKFKELHFMPDNKNSFATIWSQVNQYVTYDNLHLEDMNITGKQLRSCTSTSGSNLCNKEIIDTPPNKWSQLHDTNDSQSKKLQHFCEIHDVMKNIFEIED